MLVLNVADLKSQGIDYQGKSQIVFYNTPFSKGRSFPKEEREKAIAICKKYLQIDIVCLIVESQNKLTLWREMKKPLPADNTAASSSNATKYKNPRRASQAKSKEAIINAPAAKG
ncbi:MAG: hypothetical protein F6J93_06120 [Oscillatoria sp. SIO1A7]|nr:hypothetical protein [Oscillatoria sp. SIO1A7]